MILEIDNFNSLLTSAIDADITLEGNGDVGNEPLFNGNKKDMDIYIY